MGKDYGRGGRGGDRGGRGKYGHSGRDRMPLGDAIDGSSRAALEPKPPLQWTLLNVFEHGETMAELQKAEGYRGNLLYSIKFCRKPKNPGERPSVYLRPDDLDGVEKLLGEIRAWLKPQAAATAAAVAKPDEVASE